MFENAREPRRKVRIGNGEFYVRGNVLVNVVDPYDVHEFYWFELDDNKMLPYKPEHPRYARRWKQTDRYRLNPYK